MTEAPQLNSELLEVLRDKPHAQAYKQDGQWSVNVFNGQGDEIAFFGPMPEDEFNSGFRKLCMTINNEDDGSLCNPDFDASLI